ncbi:MAG TPA: FAD-binding oxidoreductase [Chloroflexota bacterium]|jgi:sarcosine oxidase subunit beta
MAGTGPPPTADVVVVGAGAIGCSVAYHLAKRGCRDVLVLERASVGAGSSGRGNGGIRSQFGLETEVRFSLASLAFFERFEEEMGTSCGFVQTGYLFLIRSEAELDQFRHDAAMQNRLGADTRLIDPDGIRALVPGLRVDDVAAGAWGPKDGFARPLDVVRAYAARARGMGVRIAEHAEVRGLRLAGGRVRRVETDRGDVEPGVVVDAAGAQAAAVARLAGTDLPVYPRRRHLFLTGPVRGVRHPLPLIIEPGFGFYVRSEGDALLMSPGDVGVVGDDAAAPPVDWDLAEETLRKAAHRLPAAAGIRIERGWAGLRPLTPDDHAIVDWLPGVENMLCAVGFGGHGFQHSPAAGQTVAELVLDGRTSIDITPLRLSRFGAR